MKQDLTKYSDKEIVEIYRGNKKLLDQVFEEIYDRYSPDIYRYSLKILGDTEKAKDILQETFLRFYKVMKKRKEISNLPALLIKISRNLCLTQKNNKYAKTVTLDDFNLEFEKQNYEDKELINIVREAVDLLPEDYKELFVLREYNGMSYKELADVYDSPEATIRTKFFRAKKKLQEILKPYIKELID